MADLDDSTSHGILVKAQVGMCLLLRAWHASMLRSACPGAETAPQLLPGSITITTTKDARLARASIERDGESMRLDPNLAATVGLPAPRAGSKWQREWVGQALSARIAITLYDGTGWLRLCLSPGLLRDAAWLEAGAASSESETSRSCSVM